MLILFFPSFNCCLAWHARTSVKIRRTETFFHALSMFLQYHYTRSVRDGPKLKWSYSIGRFRLFNERYWTYRVMGHCLASISNYTEDFEFFRTLRRIYLYFNIPQIPGFSFTRMVMHWHRAHLLQHIFILNFGTCKIWYCELSLRNEKHFFW